MILQVAQVAQADLLLVGFVIFECSMSDAPVAEEETSSEDTSCMEPGDDPTTEDEPIPPPAPRTAGEAAYAACAKGHNAKGSTYKLSGQVSSNCTSAGTEPMKGKADLEETFGGIGLNESGRVFSTINYFVILSLLVLPLRAQF